MSIARLRRQPGIYDGIDDPNELAQAIIANGDLGNPDPLIEALQRKAGLGGGEHSQLLRAAIGEKEPRPMKRQAARFARIRKFHPALNGYMPPVRSKFAHLDNEGEGQRPDQAPTAVPQKAPDYSSMSIDNLRLTTDSNGMFSPFVVSPAVGVSNIDPTKHKRFRSPLEDIPQTPKSSTLSGVDALKVYNGLAFSMRQFGRSMNTHIVIIWSAVPGIDQIKATKILGKYLHRAMKWLEVGSGPRRNVVRNPRKGEQMHYVWVHENAPGRGFHTHILTYVAPELRKEFSQWSQKCLMKLCRRPMHRDVFRLVAGYGVEAAQVDNTWRWYRYLMKQLDGNAAVKVYHGRRGAERVHLREVIKPWRQRPALPIANIKRVGVSHSIGETEQNKAGFQSALMVGQIESIFSGQELQEWQHDQLFPSGV